ncbi:TetR/AcrR family transcriptional regulator [Prauserella rugosa]|uniref:TetR family transcriptional regulator n=1 Tax=Prauserella rugosa TaxID=43354 RepID=A0A660CDQ7_9PSEU|nr:TetR family transcriptional regulator [Prauserella rugosa]KID27847.1 transcriptional regulator, TetR family [Prauserella sp. Am3]KMS85676.1 TetR family transcriptional regulator [Streptomyces regensis]TWH21532.1 TetR family transcriptional regulator [Prauserella rugosa]
MKRQVDGRKARGEKRRTEIIEATLRVIERDGVTGVTHRTVAAEAGVPTTSTTYHFATLDDLLVATLIECARDMATEVYWMIDRARSHGRGRGAEEIAKLLAEALGPKRGRTMAEYELYLLAARKPELRPAARRWLDVLTSMVRHDDEVAFRVFLAGIDGLLIQGLIDDEPPTAEELRPVVDYLLNPR